jgi:adenosylcobinamide kinase/adenosylcobinamide-phosphate guanylyltransferase
VHVTHSTLVLGGTRSGKSAHAEGLLPADAPATYVATARLIPGDQEWAERIAMHAARRSPDWTTREAPDPDELIELLAEAGPADAPILIDDMTTWLTNVLNDARAWKGGETELMRVHRTTGEMVCALAACPARVVLVSAEVGLGVVPETRSGRLFRDELGMLNASLAEVCDDVLLLVAGLPMELKTTRR